MSNGSDTKTVGTDSYPQPLIPVGITQKAIEGNWTDNTDLNFYIEGGVLH